MDWAHPELLDLVPALLLAIIITACAVFGFTLGAALTVLVKIILPLRMAGAPSPGTARLLQMGMTYTEIQQLRTTCKPQEPLPLGVVRMWKP